VKCCDRVAAYIGSWTIIQQLRSWIPSANAIIALGTVVLGIASIVGVCVTYEAVVTSERAWIGPSGVSLLSLWEVGNLVKVGVKYSNYGKEPALNMDDVIELKSLPLAKSDGVLLQFVAPDNTTCDSLTPRQNGPTVYPSNSGDGYEEIWSDPVFSVSKEMKAGTQVMVLLGCFAYESFGRVRYTGYCYVLWPKRGRPVEEWDFAFCATEGNQTN
jgi:hypothetical protein